MTNDQNVSQKINTTTTIKIRWEHFFKKQEIHLAFGLTNIK
jgi:hypothetical protein